VDQSRPGADATSGAGPDAETLKRDGPAAGGWTTGQQTCFTYDGLDRLIRGWTQNTNCDNWTNTTADGTAGFNEQYVYDADGVPTSLVDKGVPNPYTADSAHPHAIAAYGNGTTVNNTYSYDADGQQTTRTVNGVETDLSWDVLHHLHKSTSGTNTTEYVDGPDGTRIARQDPDGSTTVWVGGSELHIAAGVATETRYYTLGGATVAMRTASGVTWLTNDTQNSRQVVVNATTGDATRTYYTPYGAVRSGALPLPTDQGFLGHVLDSSGLVQDGARYYDPSIGQFLSPDPLVDTSTSIGLDAYGYAHDNPIAGIDPLGLMNQPVGSSTDATGGPYKVPATQWEPQPKKPHRSWWDKTGQTGALLSGAWNGVASTANKSTGDSDLMPLAPVPNCGDDQSMCDAAAFVGAFAPGIALSFVAGPEAMLEDLPSASAVFAEEAAEGTVPQGLTAAQFAKAGSVLRTGAGHLGDDIVVQGSRASFSANPGSDIDFAVRVPGDQFDQLLAARFGTPNPGTAWERTMLNAIRTGKIQAGEAGVSGVRRSLEALLDVDVDLSVVRIGGPFDTGPFIAVP
jgi:RHS repeat-associated protein